MLMHQTKLEISSVSQ